MRQTSSGSVLLMVVIISAILYLMAATLLFLTSLEVHLADFEQRSTQAFYVAESSIAYGLATLRTNAGQRAETTDDFNGLGGNLAGMNAQFYVGFKKGEACKNTENPQNPSVQDKDQGLCRKALAPSLYHIIVRGTGTVTGVFSGATKRIVERDVTIKPFAAFARYTLTLKNGCNITGNLHANETLTLEAGSVVKGDVTSVMPIQKGGAITPPGVVSDKEPAIAFPDLYFDLYYPRYWYQGKEYSVGSLIHTQFKPDPAAGAPFEIIDIYKGVSSETNPAGIFVIETPLEGQYQALIVEGTVIVTYPGAFAVNGIVAITPLAPFPAIVSAAELQIRCLGGLEKFSDTLQESLIQGLVYSSKTIGLVGDESTGNLPMTGSVFGDHVTLSSVTLKYSPDIIAHPPPGFDLIEIGKTWREVLSEE